MSLGFNFACSSAWKMREKSKNTLFENLMENTIFPGKLLKNAKFQFWFFIKTKKIYLKWNGTSTIN